MNSDEHHGWRALCDRWKNSGYSSLSDGERVWVSIRSLIDSVENGGLISYFYNSPADTLSDCRHALRELGGDDVLLRVERVAALFGEQVPSTAGGRNEVIDSWSDDEAYDQLLEQIDDELTPMISGLENKLDVFLVRSGLLP